MENQNDKYYWTKKASEPYIRRMIDLASRDFSTGLLEGLEFSRYLIYRVASVQSADGHRIYDFLIEFDTFLPSQGIYFGCKSITIEGYDHNKEIINAIADWKQIRPELVKRLNNVFVDKDFSNRFKKTDNIDNGTFWPFWISLHEDEDIKDTAERAVQIIASTYKDFIHQGEFKKQSVSSLEFKSKKLTTRTAFTEEAFNRLEQSLRKNIKMAVRNADSPNLQDLGWEIFLKILDNAVNKGILQEISYYEKGWSISDKYNDVDFKAMVTAIYELIAEKLGIKVIKIPWNSCIDVFMRGDGTPFKIQVKTLFLKADRQQEWYNRMLELVKS